MRRYKTAVDWNIHAPHPEGNQKNYHVHYLLSTRELGPEGFGQKAELELDGKTKKARGYGTGKQQILEMRKNWSDLLNEELERTGIKERVDHRSLKDRGIERVPTRHMGRAATAMKRAGKSSRIGEENREIESYNRELAQMREDEKIIDLAIEREKKIMAREQADKRKARAERKAYLDDLERIKSTGSVADQLDRVRELEALRDKEEARKREIFGQQEKNIEEGIRRGTLKPPSQSTQKGAQAQKTLSALKKDYEQAHRPPEAQKRPVQGHEKLSSILSAYERAASPQQKQPEPDRFKSASDMLDHYEKAVRNDNAQDKQDKTKQQEQKRGRDMGGYER